MKALRVVLLVHGAITLAGAFVLVVFPTAIPSAVGITITRFLECERSVSAVCQRGLLGDMPTGVHRGESGIAC